MKQSPHRVARFVAVALGAAVSLAAAQSRPVAPPDGRGEAPELRAVWVDAFHAGIRTPDEAARLVEDATRTRLNTLIVQVRRRGDALYVGGLEPPLDDPDYDPSFDALAHIVDKAHAAGLQVHAWINAMPVWRDEAPPRDPRHVFNLHGPAAVGSDCWLTSARSGGTRFPVGYFLDPGHPQAQNHLVSVYLDIVRRYAVDGIHFDYVRYPETEGAVLQSGADVGYNAVSLARFRRATGRTDVPGPGDGAWIAWRRRQVTDLVRRISIEARAINPRIKVSAASIAWGRPPATLAQFEQAAPMQRVFQNWQAWLVEGLLDLAVPMNYAREHDERVRGWFNGWIAWEKRHKAGRQVAVGVGGYLSAPEGVLAQIERARALEGRARADGVSLFSYFQPKTRPDAPRSGEGAAPSREPLDPSRLDFLALGAGGAPPAFDAPAAVPPMPWIERPTTGFLAGTVERVDGATAEGMTVEVRRTGWLRRTRRTTTDGSGWFGMTKLKPGTYRVQLQGADGKGSRERNQVIVRAGSVARTALARH